MAIFLLLALITLSTRFYGNTDIYDYSNVAKFFSEKYPAKIRSSHSYLYGFIHAPFVWLMENYLIFKITSLISLFMLVYSVYYISGKDKRTLLLMLLSPIVWYMAPWISPIQLSSLLFLWGYYFIKKYDAENKINSLFYSALLIGLSWAFWDAILFFIPLFIISFLYDKKLLNTLYFIIFLFVGLLPRLILDQILFNFAFFGIIRHLGASLTLTFYGGFYNQGTLYGFLWLILVLPFIPFYSYLMFKKDIFKKDKKTNMFIILSILLLLINSQIRFTLLIVPIIILIISKYLNKKQFAIQIEMFLIITILIINPYVIQTRYEISNNKHFTTKGYEAGGFLLNIKDISLNEKFVRDLIAQDLLEISKEHPNKTFVVGNTDDSYQTLADLYWGVNVKEFVSIQDYQLYLKNNPIIAKKEFCSNVRINERRDICASVYIKKASNDDTNYSSIKYAISEEDALDLEGFKFVKKYRVLSLFEKA